MSVTSAAIFARKVVAGAAAYRAVLAGEAQSACADKVIDAIHAGAGIVAGVTGTVVNVSLTSRTGEAWPTVAHDLFAKIQTLGTCKGEETDVRLHHTSGIQIYDP